MCKGPGVGGSWKIPGSKGRSVYLNCPVMAREASRGQTSLGRLWISQSQERRISKPSKLLMAQMGKPRPRWVKGHGQSQRKSGADPGLGPRLPNFCPGHFLHLGSGLRRGGENQHDLAPAVWLECCVYLHMHTLHRWAPAPETKALALGIPSKKRGKGTCGGDLMQPPATDSRPHPIVAFEMLCSK